MSRRNGPTPSWQCLAGVLAAVGALLTPASARAQTEAEPIALEYAASGECPSESEFLALVRAQTSRWRRVPEGSPATRRMRVVVSAQRAEASGKLVVANPRGLVSEREIAGPSCTAVSRALALMVAVAIDPLAGAGGETNGDGPDGAVNDASRTATDVPPGRPSSASTDSLPTATPTRAPEIRSWPRVSIEVRAETTSAVVRGALLGMGVSMKLELPPGVGPEWVRAWQPSVGIGFRQSVPKELSLRGGSAEFLWTAGHLRLCPFRIALAAIAAVSPCAEVNVGRLNAAADGFADARSVPTLWYDLGVSLWAAVNISRRVFVGSTLLVTAPVTRQPFALASGTVVSDAPVVGVLGGIGLGVTM